MMRVFVSAINLPLPTRRRLIGDRCCCCCCLHIKNRLYASAKKNCPKMHNTIPCAWITALRPHRLQGCCGHESAIHNVAFGRRAVFHGSLCPYASIRVNRAQGGWLGAVGLPGTRKLDGSSCRCNKKRRFSSFVQPRSFNAAAVLRPKPPCTLSIPSVQHPCCAPLDMGGRKPAAAVTDYSRPTFACCV